MRFKERIIKSVKNMKLNRKLMVIYAIAGLVPMMVTLLVSVFSMRRILRENESDKLNAYIYQATNTLNGQVVVYNNLYNYISFNQTIAQIMNDKESSAYNKYDKIVTVVDPMLYSLKNFHKEINRTTIYIDEDIIEHGNTIAPVSEVYDKEWFTEAKADSANHWYTNMETREAFSAGKMVLLDRVGTFGILYVDIDYDSLFSPFSQAVLDNYGIFITDRNDRVVYEKSFFTGKNERYRLDFTEFSDELDNKNSRYKIISAYADAAGWNVYVYKPDSLIISSVAPIMSIAVVALTISILAFVGSTMIISRFITRRITYLRNNMMQVEKGDFQIEIRNDSSDEIGDLVSGFGSMLKKINSLINEVYDSRLKEKEYEMKALQAQINPHFLYNTLSLINWKALEADQEDISKITLSLSTFYRTALNKGKNVMPIRDEIDNMRSYLNIQLMMHDYDFDTEIDIDEGILGYTTLNLILQPLIENAIDHGIDVNTTRRGKITITGKEDNGEIVLTVSDNGIGMDREQAERILTQESKGYGVRNVNERIKLFYGEKYALKIESEVGEGTTVYVRFPRT